MKSNIVAVILFLALLITNRTLAQEGFGTPTSTTPDSDSEDTSSLPPQTDSSALDNQTADTPKKKKKRKKVKVKGRIHVRWELKHRPDETGDNRVTNEFLIRRARIKLLWEPDKWLMAKIQIGGFHKAGSGFAKLLKDAYIHLSPLQYLEIRAGYFKKSFSRIALRSSSKLRVTERGIGNDLILEDLVYGERDLGIQVSGRIVPSIKLDYELGAFNGTGFSGGGAEENDDQKDVVARLSMNPASWLGFGINGSFKFTEVTKTVVDSATAASTTKHENQMAWTAGADAVVKVTNARLHLEALLAQNYQQNSVLTSRRELKEDEFPLIFNFISILSYKHRFEGEQKFAVEPVVMFELLDPDTVISKDEIFVVSPGFNSYIGKHFRVMLQGSFRRPLRNAKTLYPKRNTLHIQLCVNF